MAKEILQLTCTVSNRQKTGDNAAKVTHDNVFFFFFSPYYVL